MFSRSSDQFTKKLHNPLLAVTDDVIQSFLPRSPFLFYFYLFSPIVQVRSFKDLMHFAYIFAA